MGKSLIITEKPSVAQEFARVLHVSGRQNGYIENQEYVITWCVGHLVGMVYPESYDMKYKKWKLEDLPFLPEEYKYDVIPEVKTQYEIVHRMLHREDISRVYWAGDSGKEGQTIEENIRNYGGVREGMEELRVWIDSQTEEEILRGINEAKPMSDYAALGMSGIMRTIEDYAMGINFSRVMSVKYGSLLNDAAGTTSYTAIAVGRVMTCVLGMVVNREREIRNFTETPFYRVLGNYTDANISCEWRVGETSKYWNSPFLYNEKGFRKESDAIDFMEELKGKQAFIQTIEKGTSKKRAPLLFNLAELQAECAKRFKISPDQTLEIAQELYEKKLTTYPRTDARVLSSAVAKEIYKNVSRLKNYDIVTTFVDRIMNEKRYAGLEKTMYTDDSKVTDHYAIIPTGQLSELNKLGELQRSVFELIVRRFLSIFYPPAEYETVKLVVSVDLKPYKECFYSSSKVLKTPGYLEIAGIPKQKESGKDLSDNPNEEDSNVSDGKVLLEIADSLKKDQPVTANDYELREGKTSPPKRYTSGSMVLAMENAGQLIEDEELREQIKGCGIGTSATRAEIIKKLVRIGYLNLNKKTQILTPENLGEMVYEVVNMTVPSLLNPQMSASWEKGLDGITRGTVDFWDYRKKLEQFIRTETLKMIDQNLRYQLADQISNFAGKNARGIGARRKLGISCPVCGMEMVTTPFGYGCSGYKADKSGCNFNVGEIAGITLSEEQLKQLIEEGHTDTIRGFKSKAGKKFDAVLKLSTTESTQDGAFAVEEGQAVQPKKVTITFDFENAKPQILENLSCPECGGKIHVLPFGYRCENYDHENPMACKFSVGKIADKSLSEVMLRQLIVEGKTDTIRGFKSKNGKKFDAVLKLEKDENQKVNIVFDFDQVEAKLVKDVKCPLCGGDIAVTGFGYGCTNYKAGDESSCHFSIGKMAEKSLTEANVKQLLTDGITETIRGFKSKSGKKFDARIALKKEEDGKVTGLRFDFDDVEPKKLKDVNCPVCGGDIQVAPFGYVCSNHRKDDPESCKFILGSIAGVKLKEAQVKELLIRKKTDVIQGFVAKTGMKFDAPLKLTDDGEVVFDFPEKPKPVETEVLCPQCGKKLMRTQWKLECECGFKVWHTVAKVPLSDEILTELFTTGKTSRKIVGFTSKAGNVFDTCLKYENGEISFDFDNPGITEELPVKERPVEERPVEELAQPVSTEQVIVAQTEE